MLNDEGNGVKQSDSTQQIDLFDIIYELWRGKIFIIASIILAVGLTSAFLYLSKPRWTSTATVVAPDAGQMANYTNTLLALYPAEKFSFSKDGNTPFLLLMTDVQINAFERFANLATALAGRKNVSIERVKPVPNQPVYSPLPIQLMYTADSAQHAQAALATFIADTERLASKQLTDDLHVNIDSRKRVLLEQQTVQERIAQEQKARRLAELEQALKLANQSGMAGMRIKSSEELPADLLYLLGSDALALMIKNEQAQSLSFPDDYYQTREQLLRLESIEPEQTNFSTYRYVLEPTRPDSADSSNKKLVLILSLLLGGICGAGIVLSRNAIRRYCTKAKL